jgi:hypothetical protein
MSSNMVARNKLRYWGGAALMLGSLLFFVNKINEMSRLFLSKWMPDMISGQDMLLIIIGQAALIAGFAAYYLLYANRAGRFGKIGLLLFCSGGVLLAVGHVAFMPVIPSDLFIFVILGVAAAIIGLILFGVANLRKPILTRWQWLPLATGLMGFIGFFLVRGAAITATFLVFRTLFSLGLFGLCLILLLEKSTSP